MSLETKITELIDDGKKALFHLPYGKAIFWVGIVGFTLFILTAVFVPFLSSYGAILGNVSVALLVLWIIDKFVLKKSNTEDELLKGNVAYALFWIGLCIIIEACINAS
jgi:hypothetical protein